MVERLVSTVPPALEELDGGANVAAQFASALVVVPRQAAEECQEGPSAFSSV